METFEKRYKCNDFDGTIIDQITCLLKPSASQQVSQTSQDDPLLNNFNSNSNNNNNNNNNINNNTSSFTNNTNLLNVNHDGSSISKHNKLLGHNKNHYNHNNMSDKNMSTIDKTIVNLINSNKYKTLGSTPPHSSLKKVNERFFRIYLERANTMSQSISISR